MRAAHTNTHTFIIDDKGSGLGFLKEKISEQRLHFLLNQPRSPKQKQLHYVKFKFLLKLEKVWEELKYLKKKQI